MKCIYYMGILLTSRGAMLFTPFNTLLSDDVIHVSLECKCPDQVIIMKGVKSIGTLRSEVVITK